MDRPSLNNRSKALEIQDKSNINQYNLNPIQQSAVSLMQSDLKYLFTVIKNVDTDASNYIPSLFPYIGVVIDGVEDWIKSFNNSSKVKIETPLFTVGEQRYYEELRGSIKLWCSSYSSMYSSLQNAYNASDAYFSSVCKPIAKKWRLL